MTVVDARFEALCALYGASSATASVNDLLARWRADNGISTGDSERDFIMGFYPGASYTDARLQFWLDGGGSLFDDLLAMLGGSAVLWLDAEAQASSSDLGVRDAMGRWVRSSSDLLLSAGGV